MTDWIEDAKNRHNAESQAQAERTKAVRAGCERLWESLVSALSRDVKKINGNWPNYRVDLQKEKWSVVMSKFGTYPAICITVTIDPWSPSASLKVQRQRAETVEDNLNEAEEELERLDLDLGPDGFVHARRGNETMQPHEVSKHILKPFVDAILRTI